jgi:hypothetical protein
MPRGIRHGVNPYAPPVYNGIGEVPVNFSHVSFDYVYDQELTALQSRLDQVSVQNDADFCWRAVYIAAATGAFAVQFSDSDWYQLSSGRIVSANIQGDAASPFPILPEIVIPAGGRIGINIADLSNASNTIQIVFRGAKRFVVV